MSTKLVRKVERLQESDVSLKLPNYDVEFLSDMNSHEDDGDFSDADASRVNDLYEHYIN